MCRVAFKIFEITSAEELIFIDGYLSVGHSVGRDSKIDQIEW